MISWQNILSTGARELLRRRPLWLHILDVVLFFLLTALLVHLLSKMFQGYVWSEMLPYFWLKNAQPGLLTRGLITTLRLTIWGSFFAILLGVPAGLARVSQSLYLRHLGATFVAICRNLPPLVLVFLCYYFLADQVLRHFTLTSWLSSFSGLPEKLLTSALGPLNQAETLLVGALILGLYEGAYLAEIIRGGVQAIESGQWEAARALGFSRRQQLWLIILPQALRQNIPPLTGQLISLIKDSAILSVISLQELTFLGSQIVSTTYKPTEVWTCVAGLYLALTLASSLVGRFLEKRFSLRSETA